MKSIAAISGTYHPSYPALLPLVKTGWPAVRSQHDTITSTGLGAIEREGCIPFCGYPTGQILRKSRNPLKLAIRPFAMTFTRYPRSMTDQASRIKNIEIHWCASTEYGNGSFSRIPVIAPESKDRLARWKSVLDGYARQYVPKRISTWSMQHNAQVLSLSQELEPAARNLAHLLGARFIREHDDISASDPLYIFGKPETMTNRVLIALRDRAWQTSFLPAIDLPGASFIVAKLILSSLIDEPERHLCCDVIPDNQLDFSQLITSADNTLHPANDLGAVIIHAHGDSAHASVGNVVICGRIGEKEQLSGGGVIPGCEHRMDGHHCKRKGPRHTGICVLKDLHARYLIFLTCNAFTLGDGQYPSTSNLVVAALEGYASAVVAMHGSYVIAPGEVDLAKAAVRDRENPFNLYMRMRLRRSQQKADTSDPFVYAGLIKVAEGSGQPRSSEGDACPETMHELEKTLVAWQQILTRVGQRMIEHLSALRLINLKNHAHATTEDKDTFLVFEAHGSRYIALLQAFLSEVESWRIHRTNYDNALRLLHQVTQVGKECDSLLAKNVLARFRSSDYALGEFGKLKSGWKNAGLSCTNCGNGLIKTELSSFLFPTLSGHRLACPTCGAFEIALPSAGQLTISAKTAWQRGSTVPITANLRPGGRNSQLWREVGWGAHFGFHITHYGHVPYLSKLVIPAPGADASTDFTCPPDMHPDMYSITVAAILGGQISIKRIRTLCT